MFLDKFDLMNPQNIEGPLNHFRKTMWAIVCYICKISEFEFLDQGQHNLETIVDFVENYLAMSKEITRRKFGFYNGLSTLNITTNSKFLKFSPNLCTQLMFYFS